MEPPHTPLTCTAATHVFGFVFALSQSGHICVSTTNSTANDCCRIAPLNTSACTVSFTFNRLEWGSVHMKPASTSLTCLQETQSGYKRPANFFGEGGGGGGGLAGTGPSDSPNTFCRPLIFFRQNVSSSLDSGSACSQCLGGCRYRPHSLHHRTVACFCSPSVISTCERRQFTHILELFGRIAVPQRQHNLRQFSGHFSFPAISVRASSKAESRVSGATYT